MAQGSFGEIKAWNDFTAPPGGITTGVPDALYTNLGGGVGLVGVNEGVLALTVDEPGGIIDITTDTGDNDNHALVAGTFKPADGGMDMEVRFKIPDSVATTRAAVFVGFSETLALDTPVMPFERATATNTFNGTGAMIGIAFDSDSTILELFAVAGDAAAGIAATDAKGAVTDATGVQLVTGTETTAVPGGTILTADRWYVVRVEVSPDGIGRVYLGDYDGGASLTKPMQLVLTTTAALPSTEEYHAVAMIENRSGANERLEVDYFYARGWRDWSAN